MSRAGAIVQEESNAEDFRRPYTAGRLERSDLRDRWRRGIQKPSPWRFIRYRQDAHCATHSSEGDFGWRAGVVLDNRGAGWRIRHAGSGRAVSARRRFGDRASLLERLADFASSQRAGQPIGAGALSRRRHKLGLKVVTCWGSDARETSCQRADFIQSRYFPTLPPPERPR